MLDEVEPQAQVSQLQEDVDEIENVCRFYRVVANPLFPFFSHFFVISSYNAPICCAEILRCGYRGKIVTATSHPAKQGMSFSRKTLLRRWEYSRGFVCVLLCGAKYSTHVRII